MLVLDKIKQGGLESLAPLHIKVNPHQDGRIILNYDQLNSPKTNPVVMECRALTVNWQGDLIARSFSRFSMAGRGECKLATVSPLITSTVHRIRGLI